MHVYGTDSNERKIVPLFIAATSIIAAWLLNAVLTKFFSIPWWFDAPSVMGFYGLLYEIFDKWLWNTTFTRNLGLVKVPDLNGSWQGNIVSSFDQHNSNFDVQVDIYQTWTKISIAIKTAGSHSLSDTAAITTANPNSIGLIYTYFNKPMSDAKETMHPHEGTARTTISRDGKSVEGEYYTGRGRQNYGRLSLKRL